jgi:hypothetical protein
MTTVKRIKDKVQDIENTAKRIFKDQGLIENEELPCDVRDQLILCLVADDADDFDHTAYNVLYFYSRCNIQHNHNEDNSIDINSVRPSFARDGLIETINAIKSARLQLQL